MTARVRVVLLKERNGQTQVRTIRVWDTDQGHVTMYHEAAPRHDDTTAVNFYAKVYDRTGDWDEETGLPVYLHTETR